MNAADAYFYPYDSTAIDHAKPQAIERGPDGLTLTLTPGLAFKGARPADHWPACSASAARSIEVDATAGPARSPALGSAPPACGTCVRDGLVAIAFAFLGGLILNLMPCVFPILSMKAAALARHAHGKTVAACRAWPSWAAWSRPSWPWPAP